MAKKAILDVLEHTIGRYVLNLDAQSLNVAVWSGKIELNSLELDTYSINDELDRQAAEAPNLALPVRVIGGRFDSLTVDVPWTKMTSKPVVFRAKGLNITITPHDNSQAHGHGGHTTTTTSTTMTTNNSTTSATTDVQKDAEKKKKSPRQSAIDIADEARQRSNAIRNLAEGGDSEEDHSSFASRLVRRIIENLQVDIEDIHVSMRGFGASAGFVLESLSLVTTDENGVRTFVDRASGKDSFLHKKLNITDFGIYMDEYYEHIDVSKTRSSPDSSLFQLKRKLHSYILSPLSFEAQLRQSSSHKCINFPKYLVTSQLSTMSITLSRTQLELANKIAKVIQPKQGSRPLFPEYRPSVPIRKGTAKLWWKYAVRCIGRLTRRRSWTEFYIAHMKRKRYIPLYKRATYAKTCTWIKPIGKKEKLVLNAIDTDTSVSIVGIMGWRNMADAQVKRERRKFEDAKAKLAPEKPTGYRAFFRHQENETVSESDLDSIPISLSLDEMKELENINLEQIADVVLSKDSKLYDFKFELQSFRVDLLKSGLEPIAKFEMGQMVSNFRANNDGSYNFSFTLTSMQVEDLITHRTLFPKIVQSLQSPSSSSFKYAFVFQLKKAQEGDQDIVVKLVAFELVASPQILNEVKKFFTLDPPPNKTESSTNNLSNPILQESLSGSTDIFYDAMDDMNHSTTSTSTSPLINSNATVATKTKMSDKLSSALSEAWNQKKVRKRTWTMDCNIHAPIIVIPENVKDPYGTVLVFDMGNLHVMLGHNSSSKEVEQWFDSRMEKHKYHTEVDHWRLEMRNLTFLVGKAGNMDWKTEAGPKIMSKSSEAIVEPLSISLSAGIESSVTEYPLTCVHGVLPSISVQISPQQVTRILGVLNTWRAFANEFTGSKEGPASSKFPTTDLTGDIIMEEPEVEDSQIRSKAESTPSKTIEKKTSVEITRSMLKARISSLRSSENAKDWLHFSLALRRFSASFHTEESGSLEAHLVSVVVSSTNYVDKSSSVRLCMGWFWILDRLKSVGTRKQRLLVHSTLPQTATHYAMDDKYKILDDLERHGAFDQNYAGSTDLADISILKRPYKKLDFNEAAEDVDEQQLELDTFINAAFSSLHINWNPQVIKSLLVVQSQLSETFSTSSSISSPKNAYSMPSPTWKYKKSSKSKQIVANHTIEKSSLCTTIKATMKKLELSLNSAKDDMPLFVLTMANSKLNTLSTEAGSGSLEAAFSVGNIRIQTPSGRTHKSYNTLIGLAPNQSSSLLSLKYSKGAQAIASTNLSDADKKKYVALVELDVSPMRVVIIQAQLMALVEFVTEGVLGAMAAHVASTAKAAAIEATNSTEGQQLYQIKASGIDFVIPQAAHSEKNIICHAGALVLWYRTLPDNGGGEAKITLGNVNLESNKKFQIVENPIKMSIDVKLPPPDGLTIEDRAMRVNISFSKAAFSLSHEIYAQMMYTLSTNIGEADSFLRPEIDVYGDDEISEHDKKEVVHKDKSVTHAGVKAVVVQKRMYLTFNFSEMTLELGVNKLDPILSLSAVQTKIIIQLQPDKERMIVDMTLHNLAVEDRRVVSQNRHFRTLVSQIEGHNKDVFHLLYVSTYDGSSSLEVVVGSPQVVVLPDVMNEAINFLKIEPIESSQKTEKQRSKKDSHPDKPETKDKEIIDVYADKASNAIETQISSLESTSKFETMTKYSLKTSNCRLVLVDMGNETMADRKANPRSSLEEVKELTEAVVFQGKVDVAMALRKDSFSGDTIGNRIQFQAEQMQLYTGEGRNLGSPVQILEPVNMAFFLTKSVFDDGNEDVELKTVALTPIDMTFSMRNAALLNAILSSLSDSLLSSGGNEKIELPNQLSEDEAKHLERLSSALNKTEGWDTDDGVSSADTKSLRNSYSRNSSGNLSSLSTNARKMTRLNLTIPGIVVTMINDLQGLDQALFKIVADSVVGGGEVKVPFMNDMSSLSTTKRFTYSAHLNARLLADYFDISTNMWVKFLREPWELTISSKRTKGNKFNSSRLSTLLDIESHPCYISFSEQFLVGVGAAQQMWSMYSAATTNASATGSITDKESTSVENKKESSIRKSLAANAARALVTTMPHGINNHTGFTVEFSLSAGVETALQERQSCKTGQIKYFRFECPKVGGVGGKRVYGQDVKHPRTLEVFIGESTIRFPHIDSEVNKPRRAHQLDGGQFIFAEFVNSGRATILHLSSHIHVYNCTNIPFSIALQNSEGVKDVGVCHGKARSKFSGRKRKTTSSKRTKHYDNMMSTTYPSSLGIPSNFLHNFGTNSDGFSDLTSLDLLFCPHASDKDFDYEKDKPPRASMSLVGNRGAFRWGALSLPSISKLVQIGSSNKPLESIEVVCSMPTDEMNLRGVGNPMHKNQSDSMCIQITVKITLVDKAHPFVEVFIQPRSILENKLPVSVFVRTPMPFTFSPPNDKGICSHSTFDLHDHVTHRLDPQQSLEIFSPGSSIAITAMCADGPVAGGVTGWCEGIMDIPLGINRKLINPIRCLFPFIGREGEFLVGGGSDFYIMESDTSIDEKNNRNANKVQGPPSLVPEDLIRTVFITVQNFVVDHTGNILFEPKEKDSVLSELDKRRKKTSRTMIEKTFLPWSAFSSMQKGRRLTLLPKSSTPIHLVELTIKGNDGMRKSFPFKVDDISICEGGAESSAIMWENNIVSGYFAYRQLRSFGQSEVHIIPEFVAFNGSSENTIVVKQPQCNHIVLGPEKIAPLGRDHLNKLIIMVEVLDLSGSTAPIQVDTLGMRICVVKSNTTGTPLGSIAIQTVVGGKDSRLVIKIGAVTFGGKERISDDAQGHHQNASLLADDFLRLRIRWTELKISLSDTQLANETTIVPTTKVDPKAMILEKKRDLVVVELIFHRFTVDFQRIFKEEDSSSRRIQSPERSQLAVVVHNMRVLDCVSKQENLVVFDGFTKQSVFDLCVRFRGPINAELVKVELFDINIAYSKQAKSNTIFLNTSEDFIWRLLDVINRIMTAINDLARFQMVLDWNDKQGEFEVSLIETSDEEYFEEGNEVTYRPPRSDILFDIKTARVSPIRLQFSFKRQPQASRYFKRAGSAPGAKLMNYFTHRLRFTIQNADLKFPGYITRNMKGPSDRVIESFTTFYISRIKAQFVALMTAVSLQDWKYLTNREDGDDEFVEGDILRLTGNMAGRSVGFVFKKVGQGLGDGVSTLTSTLGNEFEKTTELIGAGAVGVRVNNLVSGVGDGVGSTVKGVGTGAGNIIRGAGRGVGHIAGGIGGGVQHAVKGNFKEGAAAIGSGVGQGIETTVAGVTDGVVNVGKGLFSGVKSIGSGLEGVFTGKKRNSKPPARPRK